MGLIRDWRRRRLLERHPLDAAGFGRTLAGLPLFAGLDEAERQRLRELATLFLAEKQIDGAAGLAVDDAMRQLVAVQACLPILNLGIDAYAGWVTVLLYPEEFMPQHEWVDEAGVVHVSRYPMIGEAWLQGPMILSWADAAAGGAADGVNVVIHECAHKLDMQDGDVNGCPPLHRDMNRRRWSETWQAAWDDFVGRVDAGEATVIDPYAAESPGEFFAVTSELFFEWPRTLDREYPALYDQLRRYYRQDPASRLTP